MQLDPDTDLIVDVSDLSSQIRHFPTTLYQYRKSWAAAEAKRDLAKAKLKETRAMVYKRLKSEPGAKHSEKSLEAEIDTDPSVIEAQNKLIKAEHDASTVGGAVESMRAKKDCLVQLNSDRRKEM
jgi:hypothetical protein